MAGPRDMNFHPSSPPSEGGADSYRYEDTPDTRSTSFSPLDSNSSTSSRLLDALTLSTGKNDGQSTVFGIPNSSIQRNASNESLPSVIHHEKDPFTSTPEKVQYKTQTQTRLSATASAFRPLSATSAPVVANEISSVLGTPKSMRHPLVNVAQSPITGMPIYDNNPLSSSFSHDLKLSRSVRIAATSGTVTSEAVQGYFTKLQANAGRFERSPELYPYMGTVYLRFANLRDATTVLKHTAVKPKDWDIGPLSAQEINKATGISVLADENEGLHNLIIHPVAQMSESEIKDKIYEYFKHYDIFAMVKQPTSLVNDTMRWIMELADVHATWACALHLYNRGWVNVDGLFWFLLAPYSSGGQPMHNSISLSSYRLPDLPGATSAAVPAVADLTAQLENTYLYGSRQAMLSHETPMVSSVGLGGSSAQVSNWSHPWDNAVQSSQMVPSAYRGLTSRGTTPALSSPSFTAMSPISSAFSAIGPLSPSMSGSMSFTRANYPSPRFHRLSGGRQNATRVNRHFSPPGPHHNHVDINKIREGTDVRTTIMLRNIPNKVDQAMLKDIVDESSWGKYDFMYLRIDFANDCNVGYAFINFVDPLDIIDFVNARGNQRWNCFKSDKIAEISYATIQGKDCLVQKFRNSSVMLEAAHYRPKLYYTSNGPTPQMAGQEEPFPEPDNQSKMKRSCENAEHVGLFTPNAGQHFRDEQRRRRSQYDRGTRLAALEECGDYGMYPHQEAIQ